MTYELEAAVHAQGWVGGQIESVVAQLATTKTLEERTLGITLAEMWAVVDNTMDELIAENFELKAKLARIQDSLR
jgi:hypothetical protein